VGELPCEKKQTAFAPLQWQTGSLHHNVWPGNSLASPLDSKRRGVEFPHKKR
jgi:hypothetical protein